MGERDRNMFFIMIVIMFILFLSLISIIFDLTGGFFVFELLLFLLFLLAGVILTIGVLGSKDWTWPGLLVFFGANLINLSILFWIDASFSKVILPVIVGIAGFLIAMFNLSSEKIMENTEDMDEAQEEPEEISNESFSKKEEPEEEIVRTNFIPGKYVASETGKKYHIPRCDWAKKISKKNIVWLDDKGDAKKKGYLPCKCVK
ncbi:hypothetical protein KY343_00240 [Candidatus Woesearchaeota archaeon]|nr:hypothetical protein [Candidatus Woesearchaeota archaeon]